MNRKNKANKRLKEMHEHLQLTNSSPDYICRGLLSALRHYCDANGLDFAKEDRTAYASYLEELRGSSQFHK